MPPRVFITREMLIHGAFEFVRRNGVGRLSTRNLANAMDCSTQPIYRAFSNMEELELATIEHAAGFVKEFLLGAPIEGEPLHHIARMQVKLMKEEPHIYHLIFQTGRLDFSMANEMLFFLVQHTSFKDHPFLGRMEPARILHVIRQVWVYTHGLFSIMGFQFVDISEKLIMQTVQETIAKLVVWEIHKPDLSRLPQYREWPVYAQAFEQEMDLGVDIKSILLDYFSGKPLSGKA
ncbi:TetR/AcrR family transcriptional regulator [Myxococcota bacterium]|nr:TetR/AcrR family transcriptional regulator [Myxococcota bacterium]